jgi:tRNA threonylcarbamoyladenosine biosynthesis protein TsaB
MLLISIDTSGRSGTVALCRGDQNSFEVLQQAELHGGTYSARLMPTIAELLTQQQVAEQQLDAFVVVSGPGSFTGLRVGIATVKGLCEGLHKPLVVVSMLEAVALVHSAKDGNVTVALDGGRGELYVGDFAVQDAVASVVREYIARIDGLAAAAAATGGSVLTPDSKVAEALTSCGATVRQVAAVHADETGRIGLLKLLRGDITDAATLDANYIRRSDAELFAAPKS